MINPPPPPKSTAHDKEEEGAGEFFKINIAVEKSTQLPL